MSPGVKAVLDATIKAHSRSPQQERAMEKAAEAVEHYLCEAGLTQTLLPAAREQVENLRGSIYRAERIQKELTAVVTPEDLDARARRVVALASTLRKVLGGQAEGASRGHGVYTTDDSLRTDREVTRAISYIIWAYLTNGQEMPGELVKGDISG